jgi:tetratricopeptide (TPR) repeat protein
MRRCFFDSSALVAALFSLACHGAPEVTRIASGRDASGGWIPPEAYAAYLEGTIAETQGDAAAAARAYERTITEDPEAAEAWARLGAARCLQAPTQADRAFARARSLAVDLEDAWLAKAECELKRGNAARAVESAERALALGPSDPEASRALSSALEAAGQPERARRIRHALALERNVGPPLAPQNDSELAVERALDHGDVTSARAAARAARWPDAEVALRALGMGRPDLAARIAELSLVSDPGDASARIAALTAADLEQKDETLARLLLPMPKDRIPPSAHAIELMEQLLSRRSGSEAARAWAEAHPRVAP